MENHATVEVVMDSRVMIAIKMISLLRLLAAIFSPEKLLAILLKTPIADTPLLYYSSI